MYTSVYDERSAALVGIKSATPNTDADHERLSASLLKLHAEAEGRIAVWILVVDPEQPPPDATWRQRLAETRSKARLFRYAIVTTAPAKLGVVTAINWIRPPTKEQKVATHPTIGEAIAWLEAETGRTLGVMQALYRKARELAADADGK